jgi:membrane-associated phospholipid phosphatase
VTVRLRKGLRPKILPSDPDPSDGGPGPLAPEVPLIDSGTDRSSSAIARLARDSWRGTTAGWRSTDADDRKRFWIRLLAATLGAAAASAASALLLQSLAADQLLPGDAALTDWARGVLSIHSAVWVGAFTSSAMVTPLLVLAAVLWARKERWERAATAVVAYIASKAIIFAGWNTWERDRPADVAGGDLVPADLASFPSGHSVQVWTVYGLLVLWWAASTHRAWERALAWSLLVAGTVIIGIGRVAIGAHYPSDILGGMVLGAVWLAGAAWAERAARPRTPRA